MNAQTAIEPSPLAKLREPFPAHQISKLPKPLSRDAKKGKCNECGGYHGLPAIHLDYVGHAALTDRLLDTDPTWTWEPVAFAQDGLPALDRNGGMWIRLTVCGVTRLGYGSADGKSGGDAVKELIGDALRNAAMRFGAALDLWHKGDLHVEQPDALGAAVETISDEQIATLQQLIPAAKLTPIQFSRTFGIEKVTDLPAARFEEARERLNTRLSEMAKAQTDARAKEPA